MMVKKKAKAKVKQKREQKGRSLYECSNAKVSMDLEEIYCSWGHSFGDHKYGKVPITKLIRGDPLIFEVCQNCPDFDRMGQSLKWWDRGWDGKE